MLIRTGYFIEQKLVHEFHTSERRSFKACRRRWDWIFRNNYYPKTTAKPLEFGVAFHKAMECWYDPQYWFGDREKIADWAILVFQETCEKQKLAALVALNQYELAPDIEDDYRERVDLGIGMLKYYFSNVSPKIDVGWTPVKVEQAFMVPIRNPETGESVIWCTCIQCRVKWENHVNVTRPEWKSVRFQGLPVVYAGRIDMIARDVNKNLLIFDWKTAASIPNDHSWLNIDDQIASYCWALWKMGLPITGFVYHEQRKCFPQRPKENKTRRLGCLFSVNKNQDVDYETYLAAVKSDDIEAYEEGKYDAMLTYLKNEGIVYYNRERVNKVVVEYENIERDIGYEVLDMIDEKLRIYPSAGRFGCSFCAFQQPCIEKNTNGDFQWLLDESGQFEQREHYYVRQEASTESKGGE